MCGVRGGRGETDRGRNAKAATVQYRFIHRSRAGRRGTVRGAQTGEIGMPCETCEKSIIRTVLRRHYCVRPGRCNSLASRFHIAGTCARKRVNVRNSISDDITAIALRHAWRAAKCTSAPTLFLPVLSDFFFFYPDPHRKDPVHTNGETVSLFRGRSLSEAPVLS